MVIRIIVQAILLSSLARADQLCPRPNAGTEVLPPAEVLSKDGVLDTTLFFRTSVDTYSQSRYCYISDNGYQSPVLRVKPGDTVVLRLKNELAPIAPAANDPCTSMAMSSQATNLHFHGLSIPPACHQDEVLRTLVAPGAPAFEYRFRMPETQPAGFYWYHHHPHGFTEQQVLGGASGAMIVEGIERFRPEVGGLPERILLLRDQTQPGQQLNYMEAGEEQEKDVSLNFVPVTALLWTPAAIRVKAGSREFWRVLNPLRIPTSICNSSMTGGSNPWN